MYGIEKVHLQFEVVRTKQNVPKVDPSEKIPALWFHQLGTCCNAVCFFIKPVIGMFQGASGAFEDMDTLIAIYRFAYSLMLYRRICTSPSTLWLIRKCIDTR